MSIIHEALGKAQSGTELNGSGQRTERDIKPEETKPAVKPVSRTIKRPRAKLELYKKALVAIALLGLMAFALVSTGRFLIKISFGSSGASARNAQEVSYRPIIRDRVKDSEIIPGASTETLKRTTGPELVLNGIMYLEEGPRAIINNFIVETGDSVLGARVAEINRESVILEYENVEITLKLR